MRTFSRLVGGVVFVLAFSVVGRQAHAQFSAPIRYNEGPGIKLGEGMVFHPGVALEGRYDSNPLYAESNPPYNPGYTPPQGGYMRVIGHIDLATLSPQRRTDGEGALYQEKVSFRLKSALAYREYVTDNRSVREQRALEVDAGLALALFPGKLLSFDFADDFARTVTAKYMDAASSLGRDTNRAAARFVLTPGGGRLTLGLGYSLNADIFEESRLAGANRIFHEVAFNAKWKILPKTAVTFDVIEQIYDYYDPAGGVFAEHPTWQHTNSKPLRLYLGLAGLITARLSTTIKLGYGNSFYSVGPSYSMLIGHAEMGYQFSPVAKLRIGFEHGFQDSIFGNYFTEEHPYLGYDHLIAQRFLLHFVFDYRYRALESPATDVPQIRQNIMTASTGLDYMIRDWVYVGLGYDLQVQNRSSGPTQVDLFVPAFVKHQIYAKVGVSY